MNKSTLLRLTFGLLIVSIMVCLLVLPARQSQAQDTGNPATTEKFSREELAQMLGPIALYPDKLLSQILMASTYPIEVIEADRWVRKNPELQGESLDQALLELEWDPSVKAVCHFPAILALMSERIAETTKLGNAFLAQEAEVMGMIQELRARAKAQGNLTTTREQTVRVENDTTIIEPANPRVIYVPYYDPFYVYGPWWYPAYRPYYWGPPGVSLGIGISFWPGISFGYSWGTWGYFDWPHHRIYIHEHERPRYVRHDHWYKRPGQWHHSPVHRRGVAYRDKFTATQYGQYPQRAHVYRSGTRGYPQRREPAPVKNGRGDERARLDQARRVDETSRYGRSQQEQQRVERELQKREQQKQPADRNQQKPPSTGRERQGPERAVQVRQAPTKAGGVPPGKARVEQVQPLPQPTGQKMRTRGAVKVEQPQPRRETVFDLQGNDRSVRQSSERGRSSRHERGAALLGNRGERGGQSFRPPDRQSHRGRVPGRTG